MRIDYMSSEDSDGDEKELKVRRIPWLLENVQKFKEILDDERIKNMHELTIKKTDEKEDN